MFQNMCLRGKHNATPLEDDNCGTYKPNTYKINKDINFIQE